MPRTKGYLVRLNVFVPVDMKKPQSARAVFDALDAAKTEGPYRVIEMGTLLSHEAKFTSKDLQQPDAPIQDESEAELSKAEQAAEVFSVDDEAPAGSPASRRSRQAA